MSRTSHRRAKPSGRRAAQRARGRRGAGEAGRNGGRTPGIGRALKIAGGVCGMGFAAILVMCGVAYAMTEIPPPNKAAQAQATVIKWQDGTKMATIGEQTRFDVSLAKIPDHLEKAVLSAENRDFYDQWLGLAPRAIARAVWVNLTSGELQGASTVTQQFAQNMYLDHGRTLAIKIKELFLTLKLEQEMSKDEILDGYLNTIYFGRGGTYGVEAAAREYFHKHVKQLTVSESVFIAAVLNSPGNFDPHNGPEAKQAVKERWEYIIDGMVSEGWLSRAKAQRLEFPRVAPPGKDGDSYGGPRGYILTQVAKAMKRMGFSEKDIYTSGLTVRTTLDKKAQRAARTAVNRTLPKKWPRDRVETGLVSVQPGNGAVRALYGGRNYLNDQLGNVYDSQAQVGSSFKPYVLAAGLKEGIGLKSRFNGDSPQRIKGSRFKNSEDKDYGMVDLMDSTKFSINTAYVRLGLRTGLRNVQDMATDAGLPKKKVTSRQDAALFLGSIYLRPIEQAAGIATFAANGVYAKPYLVAEVRGPRNDVLRTTEPQTQRAFSADIAADVSHAMRKVLRPGGTAADHGISRPAAGKTGTVEKFRGAWFVGFTPQLATAVAMYNDDNKPLTNVAGHPAIAGSTLPAPVWEAFMEGALRGEPVKKFLKPAWVGHVVNPEPTPTPSPTPSLTPSLTPSPEPTASEGEPEPTPTASDSGWEPSEPPDDGGGDSCFPFTCDDEEESGGSSSDQTGQPESSSGPE